RIGGQPNARHRSRASLDAQLRIGMLAVEREKRRVGRHQAVLEAERQDLAARGLGSTAVREQMLDIGARPQARHELSRQALVPRDLVRDLELLTAETTADFDRLRQVVVRPREHEQLVATRELAVRAHEYVVETFA